MKRLLMLNIIILILSLSACGGANKDNTGTVPAALQDQVSVSQDIENGNIEDTSDKTEDIDASDSTNGTDEDNKADSDNEFNGLEVCTLLYSGRSDNDVSEWYPDAESFIDAYGFDIDSPFFELCIPDGSSDMLYLYYDPETQLGCGYQISGEDPDTPIYGFVFDSAEEKIWDKDYMAFLSIYGDDGSEWVEEYQLEDYQSDAAYDDNGNPLQFKSTAFIDWFSEEEAVETILSIQYEYDENGILQYRSYYHHPMVFGTTLSTMDTYFDKLGRPVYERGYITHGHLEYYYIYTDNEMIPTYCLCLDYMHNSKVPDFTIYTH